MKTPIYEQLYALSNKDRWVIAKIIAKRGITTKEEIMHDLGLPYERIGPYGADWQRVRRNLKMLAEVNLIVEESRTPPEAHRYYIHKQGWSEMMESLRIL